MNGPANRPKAKVAEPQPPLGPTAPELKLATKEPPKSPGGFINDLLNKVNAKSAGGKVVVSKAEIIPATPKKKYKVPLIHVQETITGPSPARRKEATSTKPDVTSASKIKSRNLKSEEAKRLAASQSRTRLIRTTLAVIAVLSLTFAYVTNFTKLSMNPFESAATDQQTLSPQKLQERVKFHRDEIGRRLNRERIGVEFQNNQAEPLNARIPKQSVAPDMMVGVPLASQKPHRQNSRDRLEDANPDYSDNRIEYSLAEEQAASEWEKSARQQYIDDFVANAAKAGYKIKVDANGKVVVLGLIPVPGGPQPSALQLPSFSPPTR